MRIELENIGTLREANIELEGITIVAGQNNVGKSTVGKTLYAILHGMDSWEYTYRSRCYTTLARILNEENVLLEDLCLSIESVKRRRTNRVQNLINKGTFLDDLLLALEDYNSENNRGTARGLDILLEDFANEYISVYLNDDTLRKEFVNKNSEEIIKWKDALKKALKATDFDELHMQTELVSASLSEVFERQVRKIGTERSSINYSDDKGRTIKISFENNDVVQNLVIRENQKIFYIETSKIYDYQSDVRFGYDQKKYLQYLMKPNIGNARNFIFGYHRNNYVFPSFDLNENNFLSITSRLEEIMGGSANFYQKVGLEFKDRRYSETIHAANVSAGLKSIALLEYALRIGAISPGDILILDEPEINLHPEWQKEYARTIVELQKQYNLKFIITSHSPFFIRAIECFADLNEQMDKLNIYEFTKTDDGEVAVENISYSEFGVANLYDHLAAPLDSLDQLLEEKYD